MGKVRFENFKIKIGAIISFIFRVYLAVVDFSKLVTMNILDSTIFTPAVVLKLRRSRP